MTGYSFDSIPLNLYTKSMEPQPSTPPIVSPQPVEQKPASSNKNLKVLLLVLLFLLLGTVIVYAYQKYQSQQVKLPPPPEPPIRPTSMIDETARWKTYRNDNGGYSFKYPGEWFIKDTTLGTSELSVAKNVSLFSDSNYSNALVTIHLDTSRDFERSKEFLNISLGNPQTGSTTETKTNISTITINGKEVVKGVVVTSVFDANTKFTTESKEYRVLIPIANKSDTLVITSDETLVEKVDQILSTFWFSDAKTSHPDILISIRYIGGLCPDGVCSSEKLILRDGSSEIVDEVKGALVDMADILELIELVDNTDYEKIRSRRFTGVCPITYDGQEVIYTFYTSHGIEQVSSCITEIDDALPIFSKTREVLE